MDARCLCVMLLTICCQGAAGSGGAAAQPPSATRHAPQVLPGPVRDPVRPGSPSPFPAGSGIISGTVALAPGGQPAVAAQVTVSGMEVPSRSSSTDSQGQFSFIGLPTGRYTVTASKAGHVNVVYGQRRPNGAGMQIPLADGQRVRIALQLPRGGVITGMVLDERGEPAIGTMVRGMRVMTAGGQRRMAQMTSDTTDDRGIYRLHSLQPGNYAVCASARNTGPQTESQRLQMELNSLRRMLENPTGGPTGAARQQMTARMAQLQAQLAQSGEPVTGYAPVCHPGSAPTASATVPIAAGEERIGIDLQLVLTPVARVEGTIVGPPGMNLQNVMLQLASSEDPASDFDRPGTGIDSSGRFRFQNVPLGHYTLAVLTGQMGPHTAPGAARTAQPPPSRYWARAEVVVAGHDVLDVVLELQRGATVSGHFIFEGTKQQPPADLSRGQISIFPWSPGNMGFAFESSAQGTVDASGRFTIPDAVPGKYRVSASFPGRTPWLPASIIVSGEDALDFPLEVKANQNVTGVVVTLTDQLAELSGTIMDEKGRPATDHTLLLYASDPKYWIPQSRRIRTIRAGTDGHYTFRALPPGEYRLTTLVDPEPDSLYQRELLEQLHGSSMRIALGEGEKKTEHVRLRSTAQ